MGVRLPIKDEHRQIALRILSVVTMVCGVGALALLVFIVGWPLEPELRGMLQGAGTALLVAFVVQEMIRLGLQIHPWTYLRTHKLEVLLAVAAGSELFFSQYIVGWLSRYTPALPASTLTLFYLAGTQLTLVVLVALRALRGSRFFSGKRLSPGLAFILSFALLIVVGTLLLKTPQATPPEVTLTWVDALFTATSAVCVTGLTVVDTATAFTSHGHWILLGLMQTGGLGMMTLTYFFAHFFAGGVSLRDRIALQDLLSEENLGQIGTVLGVIVGFTFAVELAGTIVIHSALAESWAGDGDRLFFSLFHAVSAFCNAGFSLAGAGLADPRLHANWAFLSVIMALVVIGGIGFPVMKNAWVFVKASVARRVGLRTAMPPRLTAGSRIVLATTAVLLAGGTVAFYLTEYAAGEQEAHTSGWLIALFNSVIARTAGFHVVAPELFTTASATVIMFLMFVGGSPASTAGGIKTSTLAIAAFSLRRILLGRAEIEAFGRRFSEDTANRALAIVLLALGFITVVTVVLCALHPTLPPFDLAFEAVSAVSTVGLTRGITPMLDAPARVVLVVAMFVGRVGVLFFLLSLIPHRRTTGYRLPETTIVIT